MPSSPRKALYESNNVPASAGTPGEVGRLFLDQSVGRKFAGSGSLTIPVTVNGSVGTS